MWIGGPLFCLVVRCNVSWVQWCVVCAADCGHLRRTARSDASAARRRRSQRPDAQSVRHVSALVCVCVRMMELCFSLQYQLCVCVVRRCRVPTWLYPWVLLLVLQFMLPGISFVGHVSGIIIGYACMHTPLYTHSHHCYMLQLFPRSLACLLLCVCLLFGDLQTPKACSIGVRCRVLGSTPSKTASVRVLTLSLSLSLSSHITCKYHLTLSYGLCTQFGFHTIRCTFAVRATRQCAVPNGPSLCTLSHTRFGPRFPLTLMCCCGQPLVSRLQ
jgi:hypothetical protein